MAKMHGRKLCVGTENVKGRFLVDIAPIHEIEHPFRSCNHAWYFHIWPGKAIILGWWKKRHDESVNLMKAIGGRIVPKEECNLRRPGTLRQVEKKSQYKVFSGASSLG